MEKSLKGYLRLRVKTVVFEKTVVERQWKYDLSWLSDKLTACFLVLDSPQNSQEVNEHHAVGEFRFVVQLINFSTIFGDDANER